MTATISRLRDFFRFGNSCYSQGAAGEFNTPDETVNDAIRRNCDGMTRVQLLSLRSCAELFIERINTAIAAKPIDPTGPHTVVCISADGSVMRKERRNYHEALQELDECEKSGTYASGSIYDLDDNELDGFTG